MFHETLDCCQSRAGDPGCAAGVSYPRLRAQFFPDATIDGVTVAVAWVGAGAEDIDEAAAQVLEPAPQSVAGVAAASAAPSEGRARITLEFEAGWSVDRAADIFRR